MWSAKVRAIWAASRPNPNFANLHCVAFFLAESVDTALRLAMTLG